jgi:hypothetical protein
MPPKKTPEMPKDAAECILQTGRRNNIVLWGEEMLTEVTMLYGMTGTFFTTNMRYVHPIPREKDYIPLLPVAADGELPLPPITQAISVPPISRGDGKQWQSNGRMRGQYGHSCGRECPQHPKAGCGKTQTSRTPSLTWTVSESGTLYGEPISLTYTAKATQ